MSQYLIDLLDAARAVLIDLEENIDFHPWAEEYHVEQLALAARAYVRYVESSDNKPIGW